MLQRTFHLSTFPKLSKTPLLKRKEEGWHKKVKVPADGQLSFWVPITKSKMVKLDHRKG